MKRRILIPACVAGGLTGATALSGWATQHIAAQLGHHPALGQPRIGGLYQPFGWLAWGHDKNCA